MCVLLFVLGAIIMMIDKRLINTVADSKKWIGITVLWNWVALIGGIIIAVVFFFIF